RCCKRYSWPGAVPDPYRAGFANPSVGNVQGQCRRGGIMRSCPAVLARGGSSRGLLILESDLAGLSEQERRAAFALAVGSPDPDARQVYGVGGGNATTSKVATVAPSTDGQHDVDYRFYQIIVASGAAETRGTCGNLVAAVGQFAVEYGFVEKSEPITRVVVRDINTD